MRESERERERERAIPLAVPGNRVYFVETFSTRRFVGRLDGTRPFRDESRVSVVERSTLSKRASVISVARKRLAPARTVALDYVRGTSHDRWIEDREDRAYRITIASPRIGGDIRRAAEAREAVPIHRRANRNSPAVPTHSSIKSVDERIGLFGMVRCARPVTMTTIGNGMHRSEYLRLEGYLDDKR